MKNYFLFYCKILVHYTGLASQYFQEKVSATKIEKKKKNRSEADDINVRLWERNLSDLLLMFSKTLQKIKN